MKISVPYPSFLDLDGMPLDAGYVYIGLADNNPETNPITVYWDSGFTQPAAQPLRTYEGAFARIGTPANIYTTQNYSITIRDKNHQIISTFPNSSVFDASADFPNNLSNSSDLSLGVSLIGGAPRIVTNIATLRLMPKTGAKFAYVLGYYLAGDGGGGMYYYDVADVVSADNGGSLIVADDGGRWKLAETKEYSVKQFGAKGDGSTDDRAAIQATLDTGKPTYLPYSAGGYKISSRLTANAGTKIRGDFVKTAIVMANASDYFIEIVNGNITIDGFIVNCIGASGSSIFLLRSDLSTIGDVYVTNIQTYNAGTLVTDVSGGTNAVVDMHFKNFLCFSQSGMAFNVTQPGRLSYWVLDDITISYDSNSTNANFQAFKLANMRSCFFKNCVSETLDIDMSTVPNNDAFIIDNAESVFLNGCVINGAGGYGFSVTNKSNAVHFVNCQSNLSIKNGFFINATGGTSQNISLSNCTVAGTVGKTYAPTYDGFFIQGADKVDMTGCNTFANTGAGFFCASATKLNITGGRANNNTGRGFDSSGTNIALISGVGFDNNTAGNVSLSSSNMYVATCQGNAGTLISVTGPGVA